MADYTKITFPENCQLEQLNLSQNLLGDSMAIEISKLNHLKSLDLNLNRIGDEGAAALATMISLRELDLSQNNDVKSSSVKSFFKSKNLESLSLNLNRLTFSKDDKLPENSSLVKVDLSFNRIDDECESVLGNLASIPTLKELDLSHNYIGSKGTAILNRYKSPSLTQINLEKNRVIRKRSAENTLEKALTKSLNLGS